MLKVFLTIDVVQPFLFTFSVFLIEFSSILLKYVKLVSCSIIAFISKDREGLLNCSIRIFLARISAKFFKIHTFFVKIDTKFAFFSPLALNLLEVDTLKLQLYSSPAQKRISCTHIGFRSLLEL